MTKYYLKNNSTVPVKVSGLIIDFAVVDIVAGMRRGVYMTADLGTQQALATVDGVREISEAEYIRLGAKKKPWTSLIAFDPNNPQERAPESVVAEPKPKSEPVKEIDEEEKFEEITQVEEIEEAFEEEKADPDYVKNYDDLSGILGHDPDKLKDLAKTEGAPKRNKLRGHNVAAWREFLSEEN